MSEIPTPPQESTPTKDEHKIFFERAAKFVDEHPIASLAIAGSLVTGAGAAIETVKDINQANEAAIIVEQNQREHEAFIDSLNARYPADAVFTSIKIADGQGLESAALDAVTAEVGVKSYSQLRPLIISSIQDSAEYRTEDHIVQPGEEYAIVENGQHMLIVNPDQIIHTNVTELPTPIIDSAPQN